MTDLDTLRMRFIMRAQRFSRFISLYKTKYLPPYILRKEIELLRETLSDIEAHLSKEEKNKNQST